MYAIIATDGKQYRVEEGQELEIDFCQAESQGTKITFDRVLALSAGDGLKLGKPTIDGASVTAEVVGSQFGDKLVVQKLRRRKNSRRKTGHRQVFTTVRIESISG